MKIFVSTVLAGLTTLVVWEYIRPHVIKAAPATEVTPNAGESEQPWYSWPWF